MNTLSWYYAKNNEKHVRQVVIHLSPDSRVISQVDNLVADAAFMTPNWAVTALFHSGFKSPIIFAKATGAVDLVEGEGADVALAFYHLLHGGVFQIFVQVDSPELHSKFGWPFLAEHARWLDEEEDRRLIEAIIAGDEVELCFVAPGEKGPCTGYFGLKGRIAPECREKLKQEWADLENHHSGVDVRDFESCLEQYNRENPMEHSPVLTRRELEVPTETQAEEQARPPETLGAIFKALTSDEVQEGDIFDIKTDGTVNVVKDGFGFTEYDIVELYHHGIRKVGDLELTPEVYEMAQMALEMGAERRLSDLASGLIREKQEKQERKHKSKPKVKGQAKRTVVSKAARSPIEIWRLILIPAAVTVAVNIFGLLVFNWLPISYLLVNIFLIIAVGIYCALRLDRAGEWPPAKTTNDNPRGELGGCIGGLFVVGVVLAVLGGALKLGNAIMMPIVFVSIIIYGSFQLVVYPKLFKSHALYTCIVRVPEIIALFLVTRGREDQRIGLVNVLGLSVTTPIYATWFGMIAAAILDWRNERARRTSAVSVSPDEARDHFERGVKNSELGNYKEAVCDFSAAVEFDPSSPLYLYSLAVARTQDAPKEGSEAELQKYYVDVCALFEEAIELDEINPELHKEAYRKVALTCGALYRSLQRHEDALRLFQIGLKNYSDDAELLAGVGWSEFDLGQISRAEKTVSQLLRIDPDSDDGRRLWKAVRKTHGKDLTSDLSDDLKRRIYTEYLKRRDQSFVQSYVESGVPTKASFEDLVSDIGKKSSQAEAEVRRSILQRYGLQEFEFDLILKQGERDAWSVD